MKKILFILMFVCSISYAGENYIDKKPSAYTYKDIYDDLYLKLDQTAPQTVSGGSPTFSSGLSVGGTLGLTELTADVDLFNSNSLDVPDAGDGYSLYINRRASEGDRYLRFYIDNAMVTRVASNTDGLNFNALNLTTTGIATVGGLNPALATGLLKHTITTGVLDIAADGTDYLAPTRIDDTKGNGDTAYVWSADKSFDQFALKAPIANATMTGTFGIANDINISGNRHQWHISIVNPNAVVTASAIIPIVALTDAAITITKIEVSTDNAAREIAGDLKFADARIGLANATVVETFDTTNGVRSDSAMSGDATIPSGKCVYLSFDSAPSASMTDCVIDVWWDYDA